MNSEVAEGVQDEICEWRDRLVMRQGESVHGIKVVHAAEGGGVLERADAGPQEAPDEEARGGGAHVRHAARIVREGEHCEEHEFGAVQRERTSAGEHLNLNPYAARVEVEEAESPFTHSSSASSSRNERSSAFILQVYLQINYFELILNKQTLIGIDLLK